MRGATTTIAAIAALAIAACGAEEEPQTPAACAAPAGAYLAALRDAPGEVRLEGTTPIGDCLVEAQQAGQLATAGESMIGAATRLNREIRAARERDRAARARQLTVRLGYLVGTVQEAASATGGIHADLVRRLDTAARYRPAGVPPFGAGFERAFGEGYAAGQRTG